MIKILGILVLTGTLFMYSCDIINPKEEIPAYIHIDTFSFTGDYDSVGSLRQNIKDVWIYLDNKEFIGAYELPVTLPVLAKDRHKLTIQAGIIENGISNTRLPYPFFSRYIEEIDFNEAEIDTIKPVFSYIPNELKFYINEDFETTNWDFKESDKNQVDFERTSLNAYEKDYSLHATLPSYYDIFEIESKYAFNINRDEAIFMELNFKTNTTVQIGYFLISVSEKLEHGFMYLNPTEDWKKIYINLGNEMSFEPYGYAFQFFIKAINSSETDTAHVYLDNIKILGFE